MICCVIEGREGQATKDLTPVESCDKAEIFGEGGFPCNTGEIWMSVWKTRAQALSVPLLNFFSQDAECQRSNFTSPLRKGKLMLCRGARLFSSPHLRLESIAKHGQMKCALKVLLFLC